MKYRTEARNIFTLSKKEWSFAHCISLDCKMGAGIAVEMKKKYNLGNLDAIVKAMELDVPSCVFHNNVFNLITKKKYSGKPNYDTMRGALEKMASLVNKFNVTKVAMPKIGSGLDRLSWPKVEEIIQEVFEDIDVEILVCVWK